jgi:TRAP-type C4-dicarboxylate transport system permease small subunit
MNGFLISHDSAARPWVLWLVGLIALAVLAYSLLGYAMAGALAVADEVPGQRVVAAYIYLALVGISFLVLLTAAIALIKRYRHDHSRGASSAV